jgi:hypothetical protein
VDNPAEITVESDESDAYIESTNSKPSPKHEIQTKYNFTQAEINIDDI